MSTLGPEPAKGPSVPSDGSAKPAVKVEPSVSDSSIIRSSPTSVAEKKDTGMLNVRQSVH